MAFSLNRAAVIKVDNAAGSLQNITTYCNTAERSGELAEVDVTTFGATNRAYLLSFADKTLSIGGFWDPTLDGIQSGVEAAFTAGTITSISYEYGPAGSTAGQVKYLGEAVMRNYNVTNSDVDGAAEWSAELHMTGTQTVTTW